MEYRRALIAALLSLAVIILWQQFFPPPERVPAGRTELAEPRSLEEPVSAVDEPREVQDSPALEEGLTTDPAAVLETLVAEAEETVVVDRERFRAEFTNRGAQLLSFRLKQHLTRTGELIDMVRWRDGPLPFALVGSEAVEGFNDVLFVSERTKDEAAGTESLIFRYSASGGSVEKRFIFRSDGLFEVEAEVSPARRWGLLLGPGLRNPDPEEQENRFARRGVAYRIGEEIERQDPQRTDEISLVPAAGLTWVALEDGYFVTALIPETGVSSVKIAPVFSASVVDTTRLPTFMPLPGEDVRSDEVDDLPRELQVVMEGEDGRMRLVAYWGEKEYDRLGELGYGLKDLINLGIFKFLARPLMIGLRWIHDNVVENYGWAIILMTLLIKVLLFPLTHKSTVSMQKMQKLNPMVQGIKNKYRGKLKDKKGRPNSEMQRKMNEEVMALYKAEKVNPAGGCVPMILQLPILFAFYRILSTAIELRNAPWAFWIVDLSARDPYYVLPIVMGASQFIQQRLTPASGDPAQRRIFMMMPVFFTVLFLGFPSGLVLYWLTNTVLTIVQQVAYNRFKEKHPDESETAKKSPKAKK